MKRQVQNAGHRSQVAGHRKCNEKVRHCWACHVYLFVSFPVTSQSGMCLASTMLPIVLRVKELNGKSYTLYRRLHVPVNTLAQNMFSRDAKRLGFRAGTKHRSQVTENAIKKLGTLLGFLCLFICFISGYVTIRHIFGIDHASRCSKSKRTKY